MENRSASTGSIAIGGEISLIEIDGSILGGEGDQSGAMIAGRDIGLLSAGGFLQGRRRRVLWPYRIVSGQHRQGTGLR